MLKLDKTFLNKLELLAATGMPGFYKAFIFFLIQYVHGVDVLGKIASYQSIAQIMGYFTAIGWASLVMVRVPNKITYKEKIAALNGLFAMGVGTFFFLSVPMLLIGYFAGEINYALQVVFWLVAWTIYQIPRHYFIAEKKYWQVLIFDMAVILFSVLSIFFVPSRHVSTMLAVAMFFSSFIIYGLLQIRTRSYLEWSGYEPKGLEFGFSNFLSGGIALSTIPLARYFQGDSFAGIISLFLSIMSIAFLVPRAISFNQIPELTQIIHNNNYEKLNDKSRIMKRQIAWVNIAMLILGASLVMFIFIIYNLHEDEGVLFFSLVLLLLQMIVGNFTLVDSNILMTKELSRLLMNINLMSATIYLVVIFFLLTTRYLNAFSFLCVTIISLSVLRYVLIKKQAALISKG